MSPLVWQPRTIAEYDRALACCNAGDTVVVTSWRTSSEASETPPPEGVTLIDQWTP